MKDPTGPRALFIFLIVVAVVAAMVCLPAAAQQTDSASSAAATPFSGPLPAYQPAAAAVATPKPAPAAPSSISPDPNRKWEVEIHGGGMLTTKPRGGSGILPSPGPSIATALGPDTTRAIPSFYFGDGALLYNQFVAALGNPNVTETITPLDDVITHSVATRQHGPSFGGRISRELTPRWGLELNFDYSLGNLSMSSKALAGIEATSASWAAALIQPNSPPYCVACTGAAVTSAVSVHNDEGHQFFITGGPTLNLVTQGRVVPYLSFGLGVIHSTGDTPFVTLTGNYAYALGGITVNNSDNVVLRFAPAGNVFTGYAGGGVKFYVTPRWGFRLDVRDYMSSNSITNLLSANPVRGGTPAGCTLVYGGTIPTIEDCTPGAARAGTLSGTPVANFRSFDGWGVQQQISVTAGVFWRF